MRLLRTHIGIAANHGLLIIMVHCMYKLQASQGGGGWPLSVFLTPNLQPFLGGTYFPPKDSFHRPGFPTLLEKIISKVCVTIQSVMVVNFKSDVPFCHSITSDICMHMHVLKMLGFNP